MTPESESETSNGMPTPPPEADAKQRKDSQLKFDVAIQRNLACPKTSPHRLPRRRRELRRIAAARHAARPEVPSARPSKDPGFPAPLAAGGALAARNFQEALDLVGIILGALTALAILLYWYIRMASASLWGRCSRSHSFFRSKSL